MLRALGRWRQVRDREGAVGPSRTGITREARVLPREMRSEKSPFARDAQTNTRGACATHDAGLNREKSSYFPSFGARSATIFSKRGSPRSESYQGSSLRRP